nr:hypothetical protein [Solirubrobacterales bacterium]
MALPPMVAAFATLLLLLPATAAGQAITPERVTTGPGDSGLYTTVVTSSADGSRVIFASDSDMTPDDQVPGWDFFERVGETTRLLSASTGDDIKILMPFFGASRDATRIVFEGDGRWTADDRDGHTRDVFAAEGGRVERVSVGPAGGNTEDLDAEPAGLSADARRVLFESGERLTTDDTDNARDVFAREGDTTTKISPGNANGRDAAVAGHSEDARRVVVRTVEPLTADDPDDGHYDLFLRDGGTTLKLSPGNGPFHAELAALSADGHVALVRTAERLLPADVDTRADLYRVVVGGGVELVSAGPDDVAFEPIEMGGFGLYMTADGARVAFTSYQRHTPDDTDEQIDTFLWSAGRIVKVGRGNGEYGPDGTSLYNTLRGGADDASRLVVASPERMTADDIDDRSDLFEVDVRTGAIARVTTGPNGGNDDVDIFCPFDRLRHPCGGLPFVSVDGSRIVFETRERLVPEDTDDAKDVYQRAGGVTTLL